MSTKAIILAGGYGTRLSEETIVKPKPMVKIGNHPILWHIMKIYSCHGIKDFVIALGYKGNLIKDYFINYHYYANNFTLNASDSNIEIHSKSVEDWKITFLDTGENTMTGGRIKKAMEFIGHERVLVTYGDGLADIDINKLIRFHEKQGKKATLTAVRPPSRFGDVIFEGDVVTKFHEKPQSGDGWINGGFFVLEPEVANCIEGDEMPFEEEPLSHLTSISELVAYKHNGFWQPMDTIREKDILNDYWNTGSAPWKIW